MGSELCVRKSVLSKSLLYPILEEKGAKSDEGAF